MFARALLNKSSKEYYNASNYQHTIHIQNNNTSILNNEGLSLYNNIQEKINANNFNNTIIDYMVMHTESGMWINDNNSNHYDITRAIAELNTLNNVKIYGMNKEKNEPILTSTIIMYSELWCYTLSGSLYKLENNIIP